MQAFSGKRARDHRFFRIPQHQEQTVPVTDLLRNVIADHGRGLRGELRQHFGHLHQTDQVGRHGRARLLCLRIKNVQAGRTGIEVNVVAAITHRRLSATVVEAKAARRQIEQAARQGFRDMGDALFDRDAGAAQQINHVRRNAHAGIVDQ